MTILPTSPVRPMSTTGVLWFAVLDIDRDMMLPLLLLRLILTAGLAGLLTSTNIAASYMCDVSSAANIYQGYTLGVQLGGFGGPCYWSES